MGLLENERLPYLASFARKGAGGVALLFPEEAAFLLLRGLATVETRAEGAGPGPGAGEEPAGEVAAGEALSLLADARGPVPPAVLFAYAHLRDADLVVHRDAAAAAAEPPRWLLRCFRPSSRPRRAAVGTALEPRPHMVVHVQGFGDPLPAGLGGELGGGTAAPAASVAVVDDDAACLLVDFQPWTTHDRLSFVGKRPGEEEGEQREGGGGGGDTGWRRAGATR